MDCVFKQPVEEPRESALFQAAIEPRESAAFQAAIEVRC